MSVYVGMYASYARTDFFFIYVYNYVPINTLQLHRDLEMLPIDTVFEYVSFLPDKLKDRNLCMHHNDAYILKKDEHKKKNKRKKE